MYALSVKKKTPFFNFHTNYRREMKVIPINIDYCLLRFDALKCFLGVRLHGAGSQPNSSFLNINPQAFQRNRKVHLSNSLEINFHNISNISLRIIRHKSYC